MAGQLPLWTDKLYRYLLDASGTTHNVNGQNNAWWSNQSDVTVTSSSGITIGGQGNWYAFDNNGNPIWIDGQAEMDVTWNVSFGGYAFDTVEIVAGLLVWRSDGTAFNVYAQTLNWQRNGGQLHESFKTVFKPKWSNYHHFRWHWYYTGNTTPFSQVNASPWTWNVLAAKH